MYIQTGAPKKKREKKRGKRKATSRNTKITIRNIVSISDNILRKLIPDSTIQKSNKSDFVWKRKEKKRQQQQQ